MPTGAHQEMGDELPKEIFIALRLLGDCSPGFSNRVLDQFPKPAAIYKDAVAIDLYQVEVFGIEEGVLQQMPIVIKNLDAVRCFAQMQNNGTIFGQPMRRGAVFLLSAGRGDRQEIVVGPFIRLGERASHGTDSHESKHAMVAAQVCEQRLSEDVVGIYIHNGRTRDKHR